MKLLLTFALALATTQASALSCLPPDPIRAFQVAFQSGDEYLILKGRFAFDASGLPDAEVAGILVLPQPVPAEFVGFSLTLDGFTNDIAGPITLMPTCIGAFCGGLQPGTDIIAFARRQGTGYVVEVDPCSGWMFTPDAVTEAVLSACIRGESCVTGDF